MPTKYIYMIVALLATHTAIFYAGYFKKGEVEANKTTVAVIDKIKEVVKVQDDLVDIGLEHAGEEIDIKVQNKLNEAEVKRRVKEYIASNNCLTPAGVRSISKALGYSESESNGKLTR